MTEKRFIDYFVGDTLVSIKDTVTNKRLNILQIVEVANKISDENEQLKQAYQTLKSRHSLLHDECLEIECDKNSLKKDVISLEKENKDLKIQLQNTCMQRDEFYTGARENANRVGKLKKENKQLKETIKELELENAKHIGDGEWDIRDTYGHGKFRLEEWGERHHQFYNGDKQLEDEEVVSLLFENEQLKKELFESKKDYIIETYSNNPIRRDKKLQILKEEFKERFGDLATYITSDELLFDIINETIEKGNSDD